MWASVITSHITCGHLSSHHIPTLHLCPNTNFCASKPSMYPAELPKGLQANRRSHVPSHSHGIYDSDTARNRNSSQTCSVQNREPITTTPQCYIYYCVLSSVSEFAGTACNNYCIRVTSYKCVLSWYYISCLRSTHVCGCIFIYA